MTNYHDFQDVHTKQLGLERVQRATTTWALTAHATPATCRSRTLRCSTCSCCWEAPPHRVVTAFNQARANWVEGRRRAKEEERSYNVALRDARHIAA